VIRRIAIYDFDHTLFRSPTPPKWWGAEKSWWRDPKSLLTPAYLDPKDFSIRRSFRLGYTKTLAADLPTQEKQ
jgi:hypothetical protein